MGYFERVRGHGERHVAHANDARRLGHWAYAHIPLLSGICIAAAGLVASAAATPPADAAWITGSGIALAMLGLTAIGAATTHASRSPTVLVQHAAIACLPALAGVLAPTVWVTAVGVATACVQLRLAASRRG